ncbi:MAG: hypothetical protein IV097_24090 [Burkholderiaceae bacterium]|nr:hypothetical protein [Burkholderiaceae bacterium]
MPDTPNSVQPLVLVSWDGKSPPLQCLHIDATPQFSLVLFDFSGTVAQAELTVQGLRCRVLSGATECKGEIYQALAAHLAGASPLPEYVSLIDDDIIIGVSDINRALHLARATGLDVFSPCLSHDSHYTHRWTLQQGQAMAHPVDWVEVMMPFYRGQIFMAGAPHYAGNVSSWGIDKYLIPTLQKLLGMERTAILNTVVASHVRPVTSGQKTYRNGRTAAMERDALKAICLALIEREKPELKQGDWYRRIFVQRHSRTAWQRLVYGLGRPIRRWLERST